MHLELSRMVEAPRVVQQQQFQLSVKGAVETHVRIKIIMAKAGIVEMVVLEQKVHAVMVVFLVEVVAPLANVRIHPIPLEVEVEL